MQQTSTARLLAFFQIFFKKVYAIQFNETTLTLGNIFIVDLFVLDSSKNQKKIKESSFKAPCILICLLTLTLKKTSVLAIFGHFLLFLEIRNKLIKFYTKFYSQTSQFLPSKSTSLLMCRKPVQPNCLSFLENLKRQFGV